jgi:hypothetical protein
MTHIHYLTIEELSALIGSRAVFILALVLHVVSLAIFKVVLIMTGDDVHSPVVWLTALALTPVYLSVALRFGVRVIQFGYGLSGLFLIPFQFLAQDSSAAIWIVVGPLTVMTASFAWGYWEITRGRHAYRAQPVMPMRWRGQN